MKCLLRWVREALLFHSIDESDYRWSPAGDGGYLTFGSTAACEKAVDVAFSICEKLKRPTWRPRAKMDRIQLKLALHAGIVFEEEELGRGTNIWGDGINTAARILTICAASQILISDDYYNTYIKKQRDDQDLKFSDPYSRTVKHGVQVSVRNASRGDLGLAEKEARAHRWDAIGLLWKKITQEYEFLVKDTMDSNDPVAALAAANFVLDLDHNSPAARNLFAMIGQLDANPTGDYPRRYHPLFSTMPPPILWKIIEEANPRLFKKDEVLCEEGDEAGSCYFPVCGSLVVEGKNIPGMIPIEPGAIIGEFSLWMKGSRRTARIKALDDGLLLEISTNAFQSIVEPHPNVVGAVYGIIKQRILENVTRSPLFFPGLDEAERSKLAESPAICQKHAVGETLDLRTRTFVLVHGKVRLDVPERAPLEIVADGKFGEDTVAGVLGPPEQSPAEPDGEKAVVLQESVTVNFPRELLLDLQEIHPAIGDTWAGIWARRLKRLKQRVKLERQGVESRGGT